ncbi:hypothetical protein PIB30_046280 [Stylosanthes scabra]|uniref:Uncharacterized protein n=1 Tax=Stylosanthes scabra TaxID=79078 RepID=A0ABU6ZF75_9FABA|nr:hypothetical protein [Stylosanthes scabra]
MTKGKSFSDSECYITHPFKCGADFAESSSLGSVRMSSFSITQKKDTFQKRREEEDAKKKVVGSKAA